MIGIYINFNSNADLQTLKTDLEKIGGYEVGGHDMKSPCWKLAESSVDDEEVELTEDECDSIRENAEDLLKNSGISYSISVS